MERRSLTRLRSGSAQHRANRSQHLSKFIVQFAGNVAQRRFLRGDELLSEVAALLGEFCETGKKLAIAADKIQAGQHNGDERGGKKKIELALHAVVNPRDACGCTLFALD